MLKEYKKEKDDLTKDEKKELKKKYAEDLAKMQQDLKTSKIPIIVLVEGFASSGKGTLINELIKELDPRFASVFTLREDLEGRERYPFLYPYFNNIPENGKIIIMDSGWMEECVKDQVEGKISKRVLEHRIKEVNEFERTLKNNGYEVIKLFLSVSKDIQKRRQKDLRQDANTEWRVTSDDLRQNDNYEQFFDAYDNFMEKTSENFEWNIVDSEDKYYRNYKGLEIVHDHVKEAIERGKFDGAPYEEEFEMMEEIPNLKELDFTKTISEEEYKEELKKLQKKLYYLHNIIFRKKIPVVIAYEGMDAAGKGGNIKRLAYPLDPRGLQVFPIASPEPHEKARHFLYRFWTRLPKTGKVAIFDRTWYGRVMVERLEGFCSESDWKRAYNEINEFERELTDNGTVLIKFWLSIDLDTQLERFNDRQNTPEKQWKITDEDWRNREKWPQYEVSIQEMINKTSTKVAPWHVIESNDKKYARIKAMRIVCDALEDAIEKKDRQ